MRLERSQVQLLAVLLSGNDLGQVVHTRASVTKQYNLVPVATGKVTVGLASHWLCVTDFSGLSTYRLKASVREMSTPPTLLMGHGTHYHFTCWAGLLSKEAEVEDQNGTGYPMFT